MPRATFDQVEPTRARTDLSSPEVANAPNLWRGAALSGTKPCVVLEHEQARLEELRIDLTERRCRGLLAEGEATMVIGGISRLCLDHPLREGLWATLITAHYRTGNQTEALRCYDRLRLALMETSGVDPSPELLQLYDDVLHQHERLDLPLVSSVSNERERTPAQARPSRRSTSAAPRGVVTFLFTEVEGSTALWAHDDDAISASLRLHDEILRSLIEEHDGRYAHRRPTRSASRSKACMMASP